MDRALYFDKIKNGIECLIGMGTLVYIRSVEVSNQFISGNVPDMIYPITNYTAGRVFLFDKPSALWAGTIAFIGTVAEIAQNFGLCPGTFDMKDIPMYFIGAGLAYGIDKLTYKENQVSLEESIVRNPSHI